MSGKDKVFTALLIVLLATVAFQFRSKQLLYQENAELRVAIRSSLEAFQESRQFTDEIARVKNQLTDIRGVLDDALSNIDTSRETVGSSSPAATEAASSGELAAVSQDSARIITARERFMERSKAEEDQDFLAREVIQIQFSEFIQSLNLSPEDEEQLFQLMAEEAKQRLFLRERLAADEITREEFARLSDPGFMEKALSGFLREDEMAAFRRYQADAPIRAHARIEANQYVMLGSNAPALSDANRVIVAGVLADLMTDQQTQHLMQSADGMAALFDMAETKLEGTLDAGQMDVLSDFFDRQARMRALAE